MWVIWGDVGITWIASKILWIKNSLDKAFVPSDVIVTHDKIIFKNWIFLWTLIINIEQEHSVFYPPSDFQFLATTNKINFEKNANVVSWFLHLGIKKEKPIESTHKL